MNKQEIYEDAEVTTGVASVVRLSRRDFIGSVLCGAGVGLFVGVLYLLLDAFVFGSVLCRPQQATECAQAPQYAMIVATVVGAIAGLVALARIRAYRPLFVVLFATVSLWAAHQFVTGYPWYGTLLVMLALYAAAYGLFTWLARIRSFVVATVFGVIAFVLVRFVATS